MSIAGEYQTRAKMLKGAMVTATIKLADGRVLELGVELRGDGDKDAKLLRAFALSLQQGAMYSGA